MKGEMMMTDTPTDWRYSEEKLQYREAALRVLLARFGHQMKPNGEPEYSQKSIYECAHDWVSQGNVKPDGIVKYYLAYYGG
tara:strand:- start:386 stop:628 length:243 start_codon:yes stop_codon:yes gene_type:complete